MKICPECKTEYPDEVSVCAADGSVLVRKRPEDKLIGKTIDGKYKVLDRLAGGGMGAVYRAEHTLMKRVVALKVLHRHLAEGEDDAVFLQRFQREARTASQISHPHAVTIHDFGVFEDDAYLVMQYVEGMSLRALLAQRGRLQVSAVATILQQIGGAIQSAHDLGIIHRDLKPDNIVVAERPNGAFHAVVLDFGIAKVLGREESGLASVTRTGRILGTPQYMAPEQVLGQPVDVRTDIYALGIILYEMLSGEIPFAADSLMPLMMKHVNEAPQMLRQFKPDLGIPGAVESVVMRAIQKSPAKRQQTAAQLVQEFDTAATPSPASGWDFELERNTVDRPVPKTPTAVSEVVSRPVAIWGACALLVCSCAYLLFVWRQPSEERGSTLPVRPAQIPAAAAVAGAGSTGTGSTQQTTLPMAGVGMRIDLKQDFIEVVEVFAGSPAMRAGLAAGDQILSIDQTPVSTLTEWQATQKIRGTEGVPVKLSVRNSVDAEARAVSIVRGPIAVPAVENAQARAEQLLSEGKGDEAIRLLEKSSAENPQSAVVLVALGSVYQRTGRMSDAVSRYDSALKIDPDYALALYNRGSALLSLGKLTEAAGSLKQAAVLDPLNPETHRILAQTLYKIGDLEGSIASYSEAIAHKPKDASLHYELGLAFAAMGGVSEAIREYETAVELNPQDSRSQSVLGGTYTLLGRFDQAKEHLDEALKLNANNSEAHLHLAAVYRSKGEFDASIRELREALRLNPGYMQAQKNLAQLLVQLARFDEAYPVLNEAIRLAPDDAALQNNLGWVLNNLGRFSEAVPVLEDAIKLNPNNAIANYNLGTALGNLGKFSEAKDAFQRSVELDPQYAVAHYNLGRALERLGSADQAQQHFKRAAELAPGTDLFERAIRK